MKKLTKPLLAFCVCILIVILSMYVASWVQTDFGKIRVSAGFFETQAGGIPGSIAYKLYIPAGADVK
jgi:uncharacterized membrane protein AbrB (regulator of aidB expression)